MLPGRQSPHFSLSQASPSHDRLVGSWNPGHAGGLARRLRYLLSPFLPVGGDAMSGAKRPFQGFIGIDVSKEKFDVCGIRKDGTTYFQLSATMDRHGFEKLKGHLSSASVLIGMESTATYHVNLFSYLVSEGYAVVVLNPLLISNYVKMQLRKTKTDKIVWKPERVNEACAAVGVDKLTILDHPDRGPARPPEAGRVHPRDAAGPGSRARHRARRAVPRVPAARLTPRSLLNKAAI